MTEPNIKFKIPINTRAPQTTMRKYFFCFCFLVLLPGSCVGIHGRNPDIVWWLIYTVSFLFLYPKLEKSFFDKRKYRESRKAKEAGDFIVDSLGILFPIEVADQIPTFSRISEEESIFISWDMIEEMYFRGSRRNENEGRLYIFLNSLAEKIAVRHFYFGVIPSNYLVLSLDRVYLCGYDYRFADYAKQRLGSAKVKLEPGIQNDLDVF